MKKNNAAFLAFSLALLVALSALAIFSFFATVSAFAAEGEGEESEFVYDEKLQKWLYPLWSDYDVENDMLDEWSIYLCFDECPASTPMYFDKHPSGLLVDWPECRDSTNFYTPGVTDAYYTYGKDSKGVSESQYFVKSSACEWRQSNRYGDDEGDRIFFEITKQGEYESSKIALTIGSWRTSGGLSEVTEQNLVDCEKLSCTFVVDLSAPEFEAVASFSNEDIELSVSDSCSGVSAVFVKGPSDEYYSRYDFGGASSASVIVPASGENGEYRYFAEDCCGNCTEVRSVCLDTAAPVLSVIETEDSFIVSASDASGTARVYDEDGNGYEGSLSVSKDFVGTKTFWAADEAGNVSEPVFVTITLSYPEGALFWTEDESAYFVWDDPGGAAILDGEWYVSGTVVSKEGSHTITFETSEGELYSYDFEIGHHFVETAREDPTCRASGYVEYECSHCRESYAETLEKLEHSFYCYEASATCESGGYIRYTCVYCGESYTIETSSPTGHVYFPTSSSATCTSPGGTIYTCILCGDSYVVGDGVLADHDYVVAEAVAATCTEEGHRTRVCANCGDKVYDVIEPLGHSYALSSETKDKDGNIVRTYRCTRCGDSYSENIGDVQNETAQALIGLFDDYSVYMWWILLAAAGVWSLFMGIRYALAYREEEKEKAKRTIANYVIGLVVIAVILVAAPYLVYGIAVLVS